MWEHRLIESIVPVLEEEVNRMKKTKKADPRFIVQVADFFRSCVDKTHHGKEEEILFDALEPKMIDEPHAVMMKELNEEHEYARATVSRLLEGREMWINGDEGPSTTSMMLLEPSPSSTPPTSRRKTGVSSIQ